RFGELNYEHHHEARTLRGTVREATRDPALSYEADLIEQTFAPCPAGSLDEFLLERYTAFTSHMTSRRFFRIWHEPWKQQTIYIPANARGLLEPVWPGLPDANRAGANYPPGARDVWRGRPHRVRD